MRIYVRNILLAGAMLVFGLGNAQKTFTNQELQSQIKKAKNLQEGRNYVQAYNEYSLLIKRWESVYPQESSKEEKGYEVSEIYFNRALCAYYLMHNDVDFLFKEYKNLFPNSQKINRANFYIANWHMQKGDFLLALNTYANMDTNALSKQEIQEYNYKLGYCYFLQNLPNKAKIYFSKVKDTDSKYASVCKYYYGHILYMEGKYDLALKEFEPLKKNRHFSKVVPYYICQIYYFQGDYDKLIEMAPTLSQNSVSSKRATELNRMLGDAYYKKQQYEQALPYIEASIKSNEGVNANDNYLMGYCLMETGKYVQAIPYFEACSNQEDALSQSALYSLGYCYLANKDSVSALNSYAKASNMNFDKDIQEQSLFSYAKLSITNNPPFNESLVKQLNKYIKDNTRKDRKTKEGTGVGQARIYLAHIYERTHNYALALEQLENIQNRDSQLNKIYVKTCLNRAIELFNQHKYKESVSIIGKIEENSSFASNDMLASAKYVKAEALYLNQSYAKSEQTLRAYYSVPEYENNAYTSKADYLMAYNLFKQKKYSLAKDYFAKVEASNEEKTIKNDATIRLADCFYMLKDFDGAVKKYNDFISKNSINSDYATYQKAMAEGASGNQQSKSLTLQKAINDFPNSSYRPAFFYELGNTYLATNQNDKALSTYQTLLQTYPDNTFTKDCLGKVGMLQYQMLQYDVALNTLDQLVRKYPNSKQAQAALSVIKNIYMDQDKPEEYLSYVNGLGTRKVSNQEKEDMLYQVAENKYMDEKYVDAIPLFKNYLNNFPSGTFVTKSEYYLADCLQRTNDSLQAGEYYYKVGMKPYGTYTEKALLNAGKIYINRDVEKTLEIYKRLDGITSTATNKLLAQKEIMNIYFSQQDYNNAIAWAEEITSNESADKNIVDEAYFVLAEAYFAQNKSFQAKEYVDKLKNSSSLKYTSYAQYSMASMEFENKNFVESENIIRQMSKNGADDYYLAKAFILWSDIFVAKGNDFQAKQTLQSIIDNYEGEDDIISIAKDKLQILSNKTEKENQENEQKLQNQENSVDEVIIEDNKY